MNCKCGIRAFFFEKITTDGTFNIFKCDTQETKKKGKCDFYYSQKIKDPVKIITEHTIRPTKKYSEVNPTETYTKDLNKYISLLKNAAHLPKEYCTDYVANINYILKRLNMKFYFEDTENIESLEKRIKNKEYILYQPYISTITFPLKLTEYPPELNVPLKTKYKKRRKMKTNVEVHELDLKNFIEKYEKLNHEEMDEKLNHAEMDEKLNHTEMDEKSECIDSSSEVSDDNDNTFDVDEYNSDVDESFDTGAFSD